MDEHKEKDIRYYADIAEVYDYLTLEPRKHLTEILFKDIDKQIQPARLMIGLGCGTGQMLCRYGHLFEKKIGVDHSREMMDQAESKPALKHTKTTFIHSDIDGFLDTFTGEQPDFISIVGFLHHLEKSELASMLSKINKILPRGGWILIAEPILSESVPKLVSWINARSILIERLSEVMPADTEDPDEAPLEELDLLRTIDDAGFKRKLTVKGYEIFHINYPPSLWERAFLSAVSFFYGKKKGNVVAILAQK